MYSGQLIAFEGSDGGLRPRAIESVRNALEAHGQRVLVSRFMTSALAGEVYRQAAPLGELSPRTLALLAACDVAERMEWEILPALEEGAIVLADRYLYRVAIGIARDLDPDWLEVLCGAGPVPDLVLHFPTPISDLVHKLDPARLDLYKAGMDLALTHDLPLSYHFYQERVLEAYAEWAAWHDISIQDMQTIEQAIQRVEAHLQLPSGRAEARRLAVFRLLEQSSADPYHSRQVARLARQLFEQTVTRHQSGPAELELLEHACLLHDIGGSNLGLEHPIRSARRVRESGLEGFEQHELDAMAVLIGIHRALDEQSEVEEWLRQLPSDLQAAVTLVGPLLRLAEGLDASRKQSVRGVRATIHDGLFDLVLRSRDKAKVEVKSAVQRADLFEQAYGLHLAISVNRKGPPPAGADLVTPGARPWHER
jgi:thymidylate kinase